MSFDIINERTVMLAEAYAKGEYQKGYEAGKKDAVKHGRWIDKTSCCRFASTRYECSVCGNIGWGKYNFCPRCGAMMD